MYPLLRQGDRLPTVAAAQIMLNRRLRQGNFIRVDGVFGSRTYDAVRAFQRSHHLSPDGVVGRSTWTELFSGEPVSVVDAVDVTNPNDMGYEDAAIRGAGGDPIVSYGMCNGVRVVMQSIQSRAGAGGIVLLRFHGHGAPGEMGLTVGTGSHASSEFGLQYIDSLTNYVRQLAPLFASYGSVELHGCRVGAGSNGRQLVTRLAQAWGVPVTAGLRTQYGGGNSTFHFEGPTFTAFPRGGTLPDWARSIPVPEVGGVCVDRGLMSYAR